MFWYAVNVYYDCLVSSHILIRTSCIDYDECATNNTLCDQVCMNTFGSYECACNSGYRLLEDSMSCEGKSITTVM